jgi:hypothetical protein
MMRMQKTAITAAASGRDLQAVPGVIEPDAIWDNRSNEEPLHADRLRWSFASEPEQPGHYLVEKSTGFSQADAMNHSHPRSGLLRPNDQKGSIERE